MRSWLIHLRRSSFPWLATLAVALPLGCGAKAVVAGQRPNVILIVIDTLRADVLLDPNLLKTPNIDALAAEGTVFPHAFTHAPMTLPAHTSLFSSRLPSETGVLNNGMAVRRDLPLLAERFEASGYDTRGVISLATLTPLKDGGLDRGFQEFDTEVQWVFPAPIILGKLDRVLDRLDSGNPLFLFAHFCDPHEPYDSHGTVSHTATIFLDGEELQTVLTSEMTNWAHDVVLTPGRHLVEVRGPASFMMRRFFVQGKGLTTDWDPTTKYDMRKLRTMAVENTNAVPTEAHLEVWINDTISNQEIIRRYLLEVEFVDRYVGGLLDDLREKGLYDDSIVILTADHGEGLGDHGNFGHVRNLYDELIHVPLVIKLPKGDPRQAELERRSSNLVSHIDLAPTVLDLLGLPGLEQQAGRSILDSAPLDQGRTVISETHKPESTRNLVAIRDLRYKMILNPDSMEWEMYDLQRDPREKENVYASAAQERPEWSNLLLRVAGASVGLERGGLDEDTKATLEALGY